MNLNLSIGVVDQECFRYYNVCLEYLWAVVKLIGLGEVGLYGADNQRTAAHEKIIELTGIDRDTLQKMTNSLDKVCYLNLEAGYYEQKHQLGSNAVLLANAIYKALGGKE